MILEGGGLQSPKKNWEAVTENWAADSPEKQER